MISLRVVPWSLAVLGVVGCSSSTITTFDGPIVLTGSFVGFQEGTDGGQAFQDDPFDLVLEQTGDSITGSWIATVGGVGTLTGVILPSDSIFEFTLRMEQTEPCVGLFTGTAEARVGIRGTGQSTIGIIGNYSGDDCDSTTDAAFFVQRIN